MAFFGLRIGRREIERVVQLCCYAMSLCGEGGRSLAIWNFKCWLQKLEVLYVRWICGVIFVYRSGESPNGGAKNRVVILPVKLVTIISWGFKIESRMTKSKGSIIIVILMYCTYMCVEVSMKWIAIGELVQNEKAAPTDAAILLDNRQPDRKPVFRQRRNHASL